jgi:hypothetical protein
LGFDFNVGKRFFSFFSIHIVSLAQPTSSGYCESFCGNNPLVRGNEGLSPSSSEGEMRGVVPLLL